MMAGVARNAVALLVATLVSLSTPARGLERPAGSACTGSFRLAVAETPATAVLTWVKALR
jgi:hypothetical protein